RQRREDTPIRIRRSGSGFEVDLPDGRTRRYGIDPSGRVESEGSVFSWYLQDELDVFGNRISWFYEKDGGQPYLVRLEWSRRAGGADNSVELAYSEREDALTGYRSTFPVRIARRLERITVRAQGRLYRRYELRYHSDPTVSLLAEVKVFGDDGATALPPVAFEYTALTDQAPKLHALASAPSMLPGSDPESELSDVDGDGFPDLIRATTGGHR